LGKGAVTRKRGKTGSRGWAGVNPGERKDKKDHESKKGGANKN